MTFFILTIFWLHHAVQNDDQLAQNCRRRWGPRLLQRWCVTRVAHSYVTWSICRWFPWIRWWFSMKYVSLLEGKDSWSWWYLVICGENRVILGYTWVWLAPIGPECSGQCHFATLAVQRLWPVMLHLCRPTCKQRPPATIPDVYSAAGRGSTDELCRATWKAEGLRGLLVKFEKNLGKAQCLSHTSGLERAIQIPLSSNFVYFRIPWNTFYLTVFTKYPWILSLRHMLQKPSPWQRKNFDRKSCSFGTTTFHAHSWRNHKAQTASLLKRLRASTRMSHSVLSFLHFAPFLRTLSHPECSVRRAGAIEVGAGWKGRCGSFLMALGFWSRARNVSSWWWHPELLAAQRAKETLLWPRTKSNLVLSLRLSSEANCAKLCAKEILWLTA